MVTATPCSKAGLRQTHQEGSETKPFTPHGVAANWKKNAQIKQSLKHLLEVFFHNWVWDKKNGDVMIKSKVENMSRCIIPSYRKQVFLLP